ncbi:D-alanyl-D-alanine carboxypeptidase/D-alanyl-D-alanine-endopeptidase [Methylobacillus gramineus]|uniref:D-alanyl-D-alanine carboxypeptidase/D-alanyl-D-alanine endopeptidase n=1 Tax=Methylobacillus gramineus TaxID=755169 RepID=UPI001CFF71D7|nr:D-alanyl-D-alanine carboxypeptidase/D-alanyl-D-alanine-endopeptidase [Methylobacillus gramineus]MCB5185294.1 D-alanyl-D-alanine carboxypeptidase/D-alanyl-D-alanine-endopeptidase [Methylobacillus gramineus]
MARICWWVFTMMAGPAYAELPSAVSDILKKNGIAQENVAVFVQAVDQPRPLISHQAERPMKTASTMKLVTTYAGLELLGPAYRWRTELYHDGMLSNGVLHGNLIIKGKGDPYLMAADMRSMLEELRIAGVDEIRGDLLIDTEYFASKHHDVAAFDEKPHSPYNAAPNGFPVNIKSTSFHFFLDNRQLAIQADPDLPDIKIINQVKLTKGECGDWKNQLSFEVKPQGNLVEVKFSGEYPAACREKTVELSVLEDGPYAYNLFRQSWQEVGGKFSGQWRYASLPEMANYLMSHDSLTLAEIIRTINKYSNNLMVRQLFLTIGAERVATPAMEADSVHAIQAWLASKGLRFPELVLENGSGLSRNEQISAQHMGEMLLAAYASPVMPEYLSALPIPSVDGTMANRLRNSPARGSAHLKTGTITGVSALAGYVHDRSGRRWVAVIMVNDPKASASRAAQDALIDWVYQQPAAVNN